MRRLRSSILGLLCTSSAWASLAAGSGCDDDGQPQDDYYERVIQPILTTSCSGNTSGCHRAEPSDPFKQAAGNLDTTSFENVQKRTDLLRTYGAYPVPLFLIKAVGGSKDLEFVYREGKAYPLEIEHAGGPILQVGAPQFTTLQRWLENGATRTGLLPPPKPVSGTGDCSTLVPPDFDPTEVTATPEWAAQSGAFAQVQQVFTDKGCSAQNCHGAPQSDFYVTCGDDERQRAFNFRQVWAFVAEPAADSEILRRPLEPSLGGLSHAGGIKFTSKTDAGYQTIETFAAAVKKLEFGEGDPGKLFFADNVMPVLIRRGCTSEGCHSPGAMNDFKLRAGTQGFFSAVALEKNYDLVKREFLAFEVPDVRRGRAVAKNLLPSVGGIRHRGGPVLETPGSGGSVPSLCPKPYVAASATPFCTFVEWHRIEREALIAKGQALPLGAGDTVPLVYVERQTNHVAGPLEFSTYQPDSDLRVAQATLDANGSITGVGGSTSLIGNCPGVGGNTTAVDVRAPDVGPDGTQLVFAMRTQAADTLNVYKVNLDGSGCVKLTTNAAGVHSFDPAWSPDGLAIVYAKGTTTSNIYRMAPNGAPFDPSDDDPDDTMTWLSFSEVQPQFMREGRMTMTTEKNDSALGGTFRQLSGRRLNWDLTDYHPLLAQRAVSPFADPADPMATRPSAGFEQATEIREMYNQDFLVVLSDRGAKAGAGTLGVFNRSIGPNEVGRTDPSFVVALSLPDPAATGKGMTQGAYKSPFPLLDGKILASYAAGSFDLTTVTSLDFDLVAVDPRTGQRTPILTGPGSQVEAVLAIKYPPRAMYLNRRQLVFGGEQDKSDLGHAVVHVTDLPMLATLLGANLRRGRPVARFRDGDTLGVKGAAGQAHGTAPLESDGSVVVRVPSRTPVFLDLRQGNTTLFQMTEEHQFGPGERISLGVREPLFNHVCAGCHGAISGEELDISVVPDALTGASQTKARSSGTVHSIGP
jgi:hypothetical protein